MNKERQKIITDELLFEATDYYKMLSESYKIMEMKLIEENVNLMMQESIQGISLDSIALMEAAESGALNSIKEFFKKIIDTFVNKVRELTKSNKRWLVDNKEALLNKINYNDIEITIFPYWAIEKNNYLSVYRDILNDANRFINNLDRLDDDAATKLVEDHLHDRVGTKYQDGDGDLQKGLYNYFRGGNPNKISSVTITGQELKARIGQMIKFCDGYDDMISTVNNLKANMERELEKIDKILSQKTQSTKEGSLTLEAVRVFMEADGDNDTNNDNKPVNGEVKVNKPKEEENANKNDDKKKDEDPTNRKENYKDLSSAKLGVRSKVFKALQSTFTIILTAAEEKNVKYMNVMRSIVKQTGHGKKEKENTEDTNKATKESFDNTGIITEAITGKKYKLIYISLFNNNAGSSNLIKKITGFPYSHSAISFDTTMNNFYSFSNIPFQRNEFGKIFGTGNGFVRESIWSPTYVNNIFFDVFVMPVSLEKYQRVTDIVAKMVEKGPNEYRYSLLGLYSFILGKNKLGNIDIEKKKRFFCSEFVAYILNEGNDNYNLSPGQISNMDNVHFVGRYTIDKFKQSDLDNAVKKVIPKLTYVTENNDTKEIEQMDDSMKDITYTQENFARFLNNIRVGFQDEAIKPFVSLLDWKRIVESYKKYFKRDDMKEKGYDMVEFIIRNHYMNNRTKLTKVTDWTDDVVKAMKKIGDLFISEKVKDFKICLSHRSFVAVPSNMGKDGANVIFLDHEKITYSSSDIPYSSIHLVRPELVVPSKERDEMVQKMTYQLYRDMQFQAMMAGPNHRIIMM